MAAIPDAELPDEAHFDFTGSNFNAADFAYHWDPTAAAKQIQPTPEGLRFFLPAGIAKTQIAGLHPKLRLSGDFIATIDYESLKTTPPKESWGCGLSFKVVID